MNIKHFIYLVVALLITIHINNVLMFVDESRLTTASLNYTQDQAQSLLQERQVERLVSIEKEKQAKKEAVIIEEPLETDWVGKWSNYLISNYPNSPMIELLPMINNRLPEDKAQRLMAIAGTESSFGTKGFVATGCQNYFGYLYYGTAKRGCYSPKWNTPENAVSRFIELEENGWLISSSFEGYCVTNCEHWYSNYNYFLNL